MIDDDIYDIDFSFQRSLTKIYNCTYLHSVFPLRMFVFECNQCYICYYDS